MHFPSSDPRWEDADSGVFVTEAVRMISTRGLVIEAADVTIISEEVRVAPHRDLMRARIGEFLGLPTDRVSVKATTTDGLWFVGSKRGLAATAVVTLEEAGS